MSISRKGQGVIDITGKRFGRLVVIKQDFSVVKLGHARWMCLCDCGKEHSVLGTTLRKGDVKSCGCYRIDKSRSRMTKHGHAARGKTSRVYMVWMEMRARCHRPTHKDYPQYGSRGIHVCNRWRKSFDAFLFDMGEPAKGMTLERRNVDGGYCKNNCHWASRRAQARNTRKTKRIDGKPIIDICEELGIKYNTVLARIKNGVPPKSALHMNLTQYNAQHILNNQK